MENKSIVKILTIGQIRDSVANAKVIDAIQDTPELELHFVGDGPSLGMLIRYCEVSKSQRVFFEGRYKKSDELTIVARYDLINSYMEHDINSDSLMTNRIYLSAILRKPIIVRNGTYQAEVVEKYGLGLVVEDLKKIGDLCNDYINQLDWSQYDNNCMNFLADISKEVLIWENSFLQFASV